MLFEMPLNLFIPDFWHTWSWGLCGLYVLTKCLSIVHRPALIWWRLAISFTIWFWPNLVCCYILAISWSTLNISQIGRYEPVISLWPLEIAYIQVRYTLEIWFTFWSYLNLVLSFKLYQWAKLDSLEQSYIP